MIFRRVKNALKYLLYGSLERPDKNGPHYFCPVCFSKVRKFEPLDLSFLSDLDKHSFKYSIFQGETLNIFQYSCPNCRATDRERLYALYFGLKKEWLKNKKVLNFAPAKALKKNLLTYGAVYRSADLFMDDVDDKVDIQNMTIYSDETFDAFVCSHILEHVDNDLIAMKELYRILKKDGWGIAMVPINLGIKDIDEDISIKDPSLRWHHFGQDDHVRMYSKQGFVNRLESAGFKVEQLGRDYFGENNFKKHGIHERSVLYIVKK